MGNNKIQRMTSTGYSCYYLPVKSIHWLMIGTVTLCF